MKKIALFIILTILVLLTGCGKDSSNNPIISGGGGTVGGGNGSVTFTVSSETDQQGGIIFSASPSVSVKVTKVTVSVPAQQYTESFQLDGTTVVNANVSAQFLQYPTNSGVASGQKWTFKFEGKLASNNKVFDTTANYTIP